MARSERRYRLFNRILFAVGMAALSLLTLWNLTGKLPAALALEQETRCGMNEHLHTDACYLGDVLVCGQKAHTHSESCYLVLLKDNDVNQLLTAVDSTKEKSLENVIEVTLVQAMVANGVETPEGADLSFVGGTEDTSTEATPSPSLSADPSPTPSRLEDPSPTPSRLDSSSTQEEEGNDVATLALTNLSVTDLNTTIEEEEIEPSLTLNSNLYAVATLAATGTGNSGISTLAVGDPAGNTDNTVYFYIRLDGEITYIGSGNFSYNSGKNNNNKYYYISYEDVAAIYSSTPNLVTALTEDNINDEYYFRYGTSAIAEDNLEVLSTAGDKNGSHLNLGNKNSGIKARYAIMTTDTYTPVDFYTLTLNYTKNGVLGSDGVKYVQGAYSYTLPASDDYIWEDADGNEITSVSLTSATTVYAKPKNVTVTFDSHGGTPVLSKTVKHNSTITEPEAPTRENYTFDGWHVDEACTTLYNFDVPVTKSLTLHAKWIGVPCTVTYTDNGGNTIIASQTVAYNNKVTLPDGYTWSDGTNNYNGGEAVTITKNTNFVGTVKTYAVTITNEAGNTETETVTHGSSVTLPTLSEGYHWVDGDGTSYSPGEITITSDKTFTAVSKSIRIEYIVNFPVSLSSETLYPEGGLGEDPSDFGIAAVGVPTVKKNASNTYIIENFYSANAPHLVENLNYREVFYRQGGSPAYEFRSVYFRGWQATVNGETELFEPGEAINWTKLESMAEEGGGSITFTGLWETTGYNTVTFYVNYAATAPDASGNYTSGSAADYTPEVFCGHIFSTDIILQNRSNPSNTDLYGITGANSIKSIDADKNIRKLYGTGVSYDGLENIFGESITNGSADFATTLYMTDFPTDEEVLSKIKYWAQNGDLSKTLKYDDGNGNTYDVPDYNDIETDHYAIRWYVFKSQDDGWHVDGRLIKKVGIIDIYKQFGGNESLSAAAIATATQEYEDLGKAFVTAKCDGYMKKDGTFVTYSTLRTAELYFTPKTASQPNGYIYDADTDTYRWTITEVEANEHWIVSEHPPNVQESVDMSEWTWVDSFAGTSDSGMHNQTSTVTGVTRAADEAGESWLTVDFTNIYHKENTILIRKVDGKTLLGLSGAVFNLYQVDKTTGIESLMHFTFDDEDQVYTWDQNNQGVTELPVGENGFLEYAADGFTYDNGYIIVREAVSPQGYGEVPGIMVGYDASHVIGILGFEGAAYDNEKPDDFYAVYESGVLTVKNYSSSHSDVTTKKIWDCDASYYNELAVKMELLANGNIAGSTIPGFSDQFGSYIVWLDENGAYFTTDSDGDPVYVGSTPWSYTWQNLPSYLNGQKIDWSMREVQVGSEVADSTGNFPNWIASPVQGEISNDGHGKEYVTLSISNTPDRAMLHITKYDLIGSKTLPGAAFRLTELDKNLNETSSVLTAVTDASGVLTFDNLKYEIWYKLVETDSPENYMAYADPAYIKLSETGVVISLTDPNDQSSKHNYVLYPNQANNLAVLNQYVGPLPETGGAGAHVYTQCGMLLMAMGLILLVYQRRRREGDLPDV